MRYRPADPALGTLKDQHEIAVRGVAPLPFDYWSVDGGLTWDIAAGKWTKASAGFTYDDHYLVFGGFASMSTTSTSFGLRFHLKGPDGKDAF